MASITIRVTPETLTAKAGEINDNISNIENALNAIESQISASRNYWEGDASNTHQNRYRAMQDDIRNVIKELKDHPKNLLQMAGLYRSTEDSVTGVANTLAADVIS